MTEDQKKPSDLAEILQLLEQAVVNDSNKEAQVQISNLVGHAANSLERIADSLEKLTEPSQPIVGCLLRIAASLEPVVMEERPPLLEILNESHSAWEIYIRGQMGLGISGDEATRYNKVKEGNYDLSLAHAEIGRRKALAEEASK